MLPNRPGSLKPLDWFVLLLVLLAYGECSMDHLADFVAAISRLFQLTQ